MKVLIKIMLFFQVKENYVLPIFVEMSRKVTVMNEVNNFTSVNFGHCGKSTHFALDLGILSGLRPSGYSSVPKQNV